MDPYTRDVFPAPKQLVSNGKFAFGTFNSAFEVVNPLDARSPLGLPLPRWVKHLRLKEWQAVQLGNADWFMLAVDHPGRLRAGGFGLYAPIPRHGANQRPGDQE